MADPPPLLRQRREEKKAFARSGVGKLNGWKLVIVAIGVGVSLVLFFFWRAHQQAAADAKLCRKIDRASVAWIRFIEKQPTPPKGSKNLKLRNDLLASLRGALCDPLNLPTAKHGK